MRKLPKTIKILGKQYKLNVQEPKQIPSVLHTQPDRLYGAADHVTTEIHIASNQSAEQMKDTIIHESLHAYSDVLSLELGEDLVARLAACVLSFMIDNPEIVKYITSKG